MAMNIKDSETEQLAAEVAELRGKSKTAAVRDALRKDRDDFLAREESGEERRRRLHRFMEEEVWSQLPPELLGRTITKEEQEEMVGFGPDGV